MKHLSLKDVMESLSITMTGCGYVLKNSAGIAQYDANGNRIRVNGIPEYFPEYLKVKEISHQHDDRTGEATNSFSVPASHLKDLESRQFSESVLGYISASIKPSTIDAASIARSNLLKDKEFAESLARVINEKVKENLIKEKPFEIKGEGEIFIGQVKSLSLLKSNDFIESVIKIVEKEMQAGGRLWALFKN